MTDYENNVWIILIQKKSSDQALLVEIKDLKQQLEEAKKNQSGVETEEKTLENIAQERKEKGLAIVDFKDIKDWIDGKKDE